MSKKILISFLLICSVFALMGLIAYKALHKKAAADFPAEMPSWELITPEGGLFSSDSLGAGKIVILFYAPGCLFCEHEVRELARHAADFSENRLLFVTCAPVDSAAAYTLRTGIGTIPHYHSLIDTSLKIPLLLGIRTTPTTLLYDESRKLIQGFEGEVNAAKLLKTLRVYEAKEE